MGHIIEELTEYLNNRIAFLNSAWIDGTEYCTVQYERRHGSAYRSVSVEKGSLLDPAYMDLGSSIWYNAETKEPFDPNQPITEDLLLVKDISPKMPSLNIIATILSILALVFLLVCFLAVDIHRRSKERRAAHEQQRTHVSP